MLKLVFTIISLFLLTIPCYSEDNSVYIRDWLLCGPFLNVNKNQRITTDYLFRQQEIVPDVGKYSGGVQWKKYTTPDNNLDFTRPDVGYSLTAACVAYAHTFIYSPKQQKVKFTLAYDDGVIMFLNGVRVYSESKYWGYVFDKVIPEVALEEGWNRLLVKVNQSWVGWLGSVKITSDDNRPIEGLKIQAENPGIIGKFFKPDPKIVDVDIDDNLYYTKSDKIIIPINANLLNTGTEDLKNSVLQCKDEDGKVVCNQTIDLVPSGQMVGIKLYIDVQTIAGVIGKKLNINSLINDTTSSSQYLVLPWEDTHVFRGVGEDDEFKKELDAQVQGLPFATKKVFLKTIFKPINICDWKFYDGEIKNFNPNKTDYFSWKDVDITTGLNPANECCWLKREVVLNELFSSTPVLLNLNLPESVVNTVFVNGKKTNYSSDGVRISDNLLPDKKHVVVIKLNKTVAGKSFIPTIAVDNPKMAGYLNDMIYGRYFLDEKDEQIDRDIDKLYTYFINHDVEKFNNYLTTLVSKYAAVVKELKNQTIYLLGSSHIDLGWLWTGEETKKVCNYTFNQAIKFMDEYPEFRYTQSQAQAYEWVEKEYPELFKKIQDKVKSKQWELVGGMWVEPDCNIPCGESYVRQIFYGKRYFMDKFGVDVKIGWNPDSFGFNWSLPQIYKKCGIDYFESFKLKSNDVNPFPYDLFWWEGIDGTRIMTIFPYYYRLVNKKMIKRYKDFQKKTNNFPVYMHLYGIGDHGGGPSKEDIEIGKKCETTDLFPNVKFGTAEEYFKHTEKVLKSNSALNLPVWKDELYLEYHRGVYTTQAKSKRLNRLAENGLMNTEKICSLKTILGDDKSYPTQKFTELWKEVLYRHFHDILPGSGVNILYKETEQKYDEVLKSLAELLSPALKSIASKIDTTKPADKSIVLFNTLSWRRTSWVETEFDLPSAKKFVKLVDSQNDEIIYQTISRDDKKLKFGFIAETVPSFGYKIYW